MSYVFTDQVAQGDYAGEVVHGIIALIGFVACAIVLIAMASRSQSIAGPTIRLFITLILADAIFCLTVVVFAISKLAQGSDRLSELHCDLYGTLNLFSCATSLFGLVAITLERYLVIVRGTHLSVRSANLMSAGIMASAMTYAVACAVFGGFGEQPGRLTCVVRWWQVSSYAATFTTLTFIASPLGLISFLYLQILLKISVRAEEVSTKGSNGSNKAPIISHLVSEDLLKTEGEEKPTPAVALVLPRGGPTEGRMSMSITSARGSLLRRPPKLILQKLSEREHLERKLLRSAAIITGCFVTLWAPYLLLVLFSVATGHPVSADFDAFACIANLVNSALNPFLLYFLDNRVRSIVRALFVSRSK